jgi:hypothetical protein
MTLDEMWTRALAYLLGWAYDDDVSLVHVWSAISTKMPEEYWSDKETHMTNTLKLLEHCLKEGYLVAGETFPLGPLPPEPPPGLSLVEQLRWESAYCGDQGPKFGWRPWDMGYSEALKKIAREWKAIQEPFSDPTAMYCIVTLVPTLKAMREYDRLHKQLKLDEEKEDED